MCVCVMEAKYLGESDGLRRHMLLPFPSHPLSSHLRYPNASIVQGAPSRWPTGSGSSTRTGASHDGAAGGTNTMCLSDRGMPERERERRSRTYERCVGGGRSTSHPTQSGGRIQALVGRASISWGQPLLSS